MDENGPYKTAVLWRGTRGEASRNSPEQSLSPRLRGTGGTGHPRRTDSLCRRHCRTGPGSAFGSGLRARLGLWVDPIHQGKTWTVLDAILRDVAVRHPWVSAHPDVISRWASRKSCTEIIDPAVRRAADPRLLLDHRDQRLLRALAGFQKVGNSCPAATGGAAEAQCQWDGCCRDAVTRPCSRVAAEASTVAASMVAGSGSVAAASVGGGWGWRGGGWGWGWPAGWWGWGLGWGWGPGWGSGWVWIPGWGWV